MKTVKLIPAVAVFALLSPSAFAGDASGTVDVGGHVTGICAVLTDGSPGNTFSGTIDLGELAGPDAKLLPGLTGASIAGASKSFTVICNTSAPSVSLVATRMVGNAPSVLSGFTQTIDYTAKLDVVKADSTASSFTYATAGSPPATTGVLSAPLSGTPNNVTVSVNSLATDGNFLMSGQYGQALGGTGGVITITITPAVAS